MPCVPLQSRSRSNSERGSKENVVPGTIAVGGNGIELLFSISKVAVILDAGTQSESTVASRLIDSSGSKIEVEIGDVPAFRN